MRRLLVALLTIFTGACCTSLPRLAPKSGSLPLPPVDPDGVRETSETWRDAKRERDVPVKVYEREHSAGRRPLVVFSHGIGEDRQSYAWLGRLLAGHGFRVVHVTHHGTDRAMLERGYLHLYRAVKQKENWVNRALDVSFVLDRLDPDDVPVAVVGHSAGAFTAFAVAGLGTADGTLRDPRVSVAVAMSMPRLDGVVPAGGYDAVEVPLLNLTGTCDTSLIYRTFPKHRRIPFDATRAARQYLVTLEGVNHDDFVSDHDAIGAVVSAFLRGWMLDDAAARAWFDEPGSGAVLGVRAAVERKAHGAR
jgi:dienelactone hydrolase